MGSRTSWAKTYGGFGIDIFWSVQQTSDRGFVAAGESGSFGASDTWVVKIDTLGKPVWQGVYGGGGCEGAQSVRQMPDGGFAVLTDLQACLLRLDAFGNVLWEKSYRGPGNNEGFSMELTSGGGFIVAGRTNYGDRPSDAFALRLDSKGNMVWQKTYGGTSTDVFDSVVELSDGGFLVIGTTYSFGAGDKDAWVLRLDASGNIIWQRTYGGPRTDQILSLTQIGDGSFVVAGGTDSFGAGNFDAWVLRLDSTGDILWQKAYGGAFPDQAESVIETSDNALLVAGALGCQGPGCLDGWFMKINLRGEVLWQTSYGAPFFEAIFSVRETTDRGFIAAGHTKSFGVPGEESSGDAWVLRLDRSGRIPGQCGNRGPLNVSAIDTNSTTTFSQAVVSDISTNVTETTALLTATSATIGAQCLLNTRRP